MAPFVATSVRNHCSIDAINHDARNVGLHHVPISAKRRHDVLLRAVREVRGGGGGGGGGSAAFDNGYEYLADTHADNNSISTSDSESNNFHDNHRPTGTSTSTSSPPTPSTTTGPDDANSVIASFEEELVRIRLQIEAEAEREWEMWRKQMLERRRVRKKLLQSNLQKEKEKEEEEKVEAEPEVCAETDTSTSTNVDQYENESMEWPLVDESEETALESEIILLGEEGITTSSSTQDTDVVDEVAPLEDEGGKDENLEDSIQVQDDIESNEEDESGYDEQTTTNDYSEEAFSIQGDIDDGEENDSDAQEDIGLIGDYDAPTDSDDELSGHEENEAFQEDYEKRDISAHSEGSGAATSNMEVESDDLNVPVERQVNESDDLACSIPKKRRKQKKKKKKKKKKRKKSQRQAEADAEERSDDTWRTSLSQADVALAPTKESSSALRPPSFTRKVVFYLGFAAFLSLFKMILDALVRMGLQ